MSAQSVQSFLGYQMEFGTFQPKFGSQGDALKTMGIPIQHARGLHLSFRFNDKITLDFGWQGKYYRLKQTDQSMTTTYSAGQGFAVTSKSKVGNYSMGLGYSMRVSERMYFKVQGNLVLDNLRKKDSLLSVKTSAGYYQVVYNATYQRLNVYLMPFVGLEFRMDKGKIFKIGIQQNLSLGKGFVDYEYRRTNNLNQSLLIEKGRHNGKFSALVIGLDFPISEKSYDKAALAKLPKIPKASKEPRAPRVKRETVVIKDTVHVKETIVVKDTIKVKETVTVKDTVKVTIVDTIKTQVKVTEDNSKLLAEFKNRTQVKMGEFAANTNQITIQVYDNGMEDGDIVSVFVNDQVVLKEYTLVKSKHEFKVELQPGENTITLFAHNLGKFKPNTMAMIVSDGTNQKSLVLNSDFNSSGSLKVIVAK
jgi:hypothetical protein